MNQLLKRLASPRLALGALGFLIVYSALAAFGPEKWSGDHAFRSPIFLVTVAVIYASTFACTWLRTGVVARLWRGRLPSTAIEFSCHDTASLEAFLNQHGFRGRGTIRRRFPYALWAGWLLHVALLTLVTGVGVQLLFYDAGAFEVAIGETIELSAPKTVIDRLHGPFAAKAPPEIKVCLAGYDPHMHQPGYSPDRLSVLQIETGSGALYERVMDRAKGVEVEGVTIYQQLASGIALVLEFGEGKQRAIHLQNESEKRAFADVIAPGEQPVRFEISSNEGLNHRRGSGLIDVRVFREGISAELKVGDLFRFGSGEARFVDIVRWSGFSYARSPGIEAVFVGFTFVLIACALLLFPAGVAVLSDNSRGWVARVWVNRGSVLLQSDWRSWCDEHVQSKSEEER